MHSIFEYHRGTTGCKSSEHALLESLPVLCDKRSGKGRSRKGYRNNIGGQGYHFLR